MRAPGNGPTATVPSYDPSSAAPGALAADARRIHAESVHYWATYATSAFFARPAPDIWAAADQVRHLTKSIRAVTKGLALPRLVLVVCFGWSRGAKRAFEDLRTRYKAALANGAGAGRFAPRPLPSSEATDASRARVMAQHAEAVEAFAARIASWPDPALDHYRLPHPILGKLTLREMAQFTLLHNVHHVAVAERRRHELEG